MQSKRPRLWNDHLQWPTILGYNNLGLLRRREKPFDPRNLSRFKIILRCDRLQFIRFWAKEVDHITLAVCCDEAIIGSESRVNATQKCQDALPLYSSGCQQQRLTSIPKQVGVACRNMFAAKEGACGLRRRRERSSQLHNLASQKAFPVKLADYSGRGGRNSVKTKGPIYRGHLVGGEHKSFDKSLELLSPLIVLRLALDECRCLTSQRFANSCVNLIQVPLALSRNLPTQTA